MGGSPWAAALLQRGRARRVWGRGVGPGQFYPRPTALVASSPLRRGVGWAARRVFHLGGVWRWRMLYPGFRCCRPLVDLRSGVTEVSGMRKEVSLVMASRLGVTVKLPLSPPEPVVPAEQESCAGGSHPAALKPWRTATNSWLAAASSLQERRFLFVIL